MYLNFYQLRQEPFQITPDPAFLYLSPTHKEALASIIYGIQSRKGFIAIIGEVGVGKTTIVRSYLAGSHRRKVKPIYLFNANVTFEELVTTICRELDLDTKDRDLHGMIYRLHRALIEEYDRGNNVVLIVDEAQNMPVETLEKLRMLSNLETDKEKLLQIVLVAQPELNEKLNRSELRQLKQRIAVRATINPLTREESLAYIKRRLSEVALGEGEIFTARALRKIVLHAGGIPRLINILCDNALIAGYGYQKKPVSSRIVREVIADFQGRPRPRFSWWRLVPAGAALALAGLVMATPYGGAFFSTARSTLLALREKTPDKIEYTSSKSLSDSAKLDEPRADAPALDALDAVDEDSENGVPHVTIGDDSGLETEAGVSGQSARVVDAGPPKTVHEDEPNETDSQSSTDGEARAAQISEKHFVTAASAVELTDPKLIAAAIAQILGAVPFRPVPSWLGTSATQVINHAQTAPVREIEEPAKEDRSTDLSTKKVVREGDNLSSLCVSVYGFSNSKLLQFVKSHNPRIDDLNHILVGQEIIFPEIPPEISEGLTELPTTRPEMSGSNLASVRMVPND